MFDHKMTMQQEFKFNGMKDGMKWKGKVGIYFISCAPVLMEILAWAKRQDQQIIDVDKFKEVVGYKLHYDQVLGVNVVLWCFQSGVGFGSAETMFKRADQFNGLDA